VGIARKNKNVTTSIQTNNKKKPYKLTTKPIWVDGTFFTVLPNKDPLRCRN